MVEPRARDRRQYDSRRLAIGFVFVVALSAATMAAYGGAGPLAVVAAAAVGLLLGVGLLLALGVWP